PPIPHHHQPANRLKPSADLTRGVREITPMAQDSTRQVTETSAEQIAFRSSLCRRVYGPRTASDDDTYDTAKLMRFEHLGREVPWRAGRETRARSPARRNADTVAARESNNSCLVRAQEGRILLYGQLVEMQRHPRLRTARNGAANDASAVRADITAIQFG